MPFQSSRTFDFVHIHMDKKESIHKHVLVFTAEHRVNTWEKTLKKNSHQYTSITHLNTPERTPKHTLIEII